MTADYSSLSQSDLLLLVRQFSNLTAETNLQKALNQILTDAANLTTSTSSSILLLDDRRNKLYFAAATGENAGLLLEEWGELGQKRVPVDGSMAGRAYSTLQTIVSEKADQDPDHFAKVDAQTLKTTHSMISMPLQVAGQPLGAMQILNKLDGGYSQRDISLLQCFADQAAIVIRNAKLFESLVAHWGLYASRSQTSTLENLVAEMNRPPCREDLTVMFVDMRAFTQLSQISDGAKLQNKINDYFSMISDLVLKHGGIVNKLMGDGALCLFRSDDYAPRAVRCAFEIVRRFGELKESWISTSNQALDFLDIGMGIVTDEVMIGAFGSKQLRDFTAMGPAVNLAAFFEKLARNGKHILADNATYQLAKDFVEPVDRPEIIELRKQNQSVGIPYQMYHLKPKMVSQMSQQHIFISYCHDNAAEVAKLRNDLMDAGENVWWDQDIVGGQDWKIAIHQAMKRSYAIVLCLSQETEKRYQSGIYPEILDAIGAYREYAPGSVFLIPVRLSDCSIPPIEIDATRMLDRLQHIDLFPAARRDEGIQKLIQAIRSAPKHP
jgi:adenylate cyclase